MASACSRNTTQPPPSTPAAPTTNEQATQSRIEANERQPDPAPSVDGDAVVSMEMSMEVIEPSTKGNPLDIQVCATLFDKDHQPVAAEGQFSADDGGKLGISAGVYAYKPMFVAGKVGNYSSSLMICPAAAQMWPASQAEASGRNFPVTLTFTTSTGRVLTASTSHTF